MSKWMGFLVLLSATTSFAAVDPQLEIVEVDVREVHSVDRMTKEQLPKSTIRYLTSGSSASGVSGTAKIGDLSLDINIGEKKDKVDKSKQMNALLSDVLDPLKLTNKILDEVINIGKKVFDVVKKGQPVVNLASDVATALPGGTKSWNELDGWDAPRSKTYNVTYYNLPGFKVVNFDYKIIYIAGGSVNGKGKYIGYATIEPTNLQVGWQYELSATAKVERVYFKGSRDNPIAAMLLSFEHEVKIVTDYKRVKDYFEITGDGVVRKIEDNQ